MGKTLVAYFAKNPGLRDIGEIVVGLDDVLESGADGLEHRFNIVVDLADLLAQVLAGELPLGVHRYLPRYEKQAAAFHLHHVAVRFGIEQRGRRAVANLEARRCLARCCPRARGMRAVASGTAFHGCTSSSELRESPARVAPALRATRHSTGRGSRRARYEHRGCAQERP